MEYNETLYGKQYLLGTDVYVDGKHRILNVPLIDLMERNGFIPDNVDVNQIYDLSVVWYEDDGDVMVHQIYDHESGEIYWEDKPTDEWTDNDEELLTALLMFGNLQETIGEIY